jgi:hypothetical protein
VHEHYAGTLDVSTEDPGDAGAVGLGSFDIRWGDLHVKTEARLTLRSDASTYHLKMELDALEDGRPKWSRTWERSIPRKLQ